LSDDGGTAPGALAGRDGALERQTLNCGRLLAAARAGRRKLGATALAAGAIGIVLGSWHTSLASLPADAQVPAPSAPSPVAFPSQVPCPSPAAGTVCTPAPSENGSSNPPPALPESAAPNGTCTPRSATAPNTWTAYGSPRAIDYSTFATSPAYSDPAEQYGIGSDEGGSLYPLPFLPVVDPTLPCRSYRLSIDGHSIERSTDNGVTWLTVFDGTRMSSPPQFRHISIGGEATGHPVVFVSEVKNGDGLIESSDAGSTWHLADGWDAAHPNATNLVGAYVFAATPSVQDANLLYVIEAACQDQRPHKSTACLSSPTARKPPFDTSDQEYKGQAYPIGTIRLYVSHDRGATWARLADPNIDSVNGVPDNCNVTYAWIVSDPRSQIIGGVLHDHMWIDFEADAPCVNQENQVDGTWDGTTTDATTTYHLDQDNNHHGAPVTRPIQQEMGSLPYAVGRGPLGTRLVSGSALGTNYFSDDDGVTWKPILVNNITYSSVTADPSGNLFLFGITVFGNSEDALPHEPRAYVMVPTAGGYEVHLGATFPSGLSNFARYGSNWAPFDRYERSLFDWPGYDPLIPPLGSAEIAQSLFGASMQRDNTGAYYVVVGTRCDQAGCRWDGKVPDSSAGKTGNRFATWAEWRVLRYTPPANAGSLVTLSNVYDPDYELYNGTTAPSLSAGCQNQGRCQLVPIAQCHIAADGQDGNGVLAFDGSELIYSVSGEPGPRPYTALLHRLRPSDCTGNNTASAKASGTITVQFAAGEYDLARSLTWLDFGAGLHYVSQPAVDATSPSIDTMTYDATHDRLYFTLSPQVSGPVRAENQLSLWSADLHSVGGAPSSSVTARLVTVDTGYCPPIGGGPNHGAASQALAFDRVDGSVWACLPGRPAKLDTAGHQLDEPCYQTPDIQGNGGTGFHVFSWSMMDMLPGSGQNRAYLLEEAGSTSADRPLVQFDLASCQEGRDYTFVSASSFYPQHGSLTLACDPVTFGSGALPADPPTQSALASKYPGVTFTGTPLGAVMWAKTGNQLTALLLPDNGDSPARQAEAQTCRLPVDLSIDSQQSTASSSAVAICATLSVHGPSAPIANQQVTAKLDGSDVTHQLNGSGLTGSDGPGRVCLPGQALGVGRHTVQFSYRPIAANLAYYPADASADVLIGPSGGPAPTLPPNPPGGLQTKPGSHPLLIVPPLSLAANPAVEPVAQGQGQPVAQAQGQTAAAEEREEEQELAYAYEMPDEEKPAEAGQPPGEGPGSYAMSALGSHNGGDVLARGGVNPATLLVAVAALAVGLRWSYGRRRQAVYGRSRQRRW
jgi:hypothetical protein